MIKIAPGNIIFSWEVPHCAPQQWLIEDKALRLPRDHLHSNISSITPKLYDPRQVAKCLYTLVSSSVHTSRNDLNHRF